MQKRIKHRGWSLRGFTGAAGAVVTSGVSDRKHDVATCFRKFCALSSLISLSMFPETTAPEITAKALSDLDG